MNELEIVDQKQNAVAVRESGPLSVNQVKAGLQAINEVMANCMKEGQDYGKIPGCGEKPGLFQPGAQKLSMMFQLNPEVRQEVITDYPNFHRGYRMTVRVTNGAKFADGVGECSTMESRYRYRSGGKKCPECGKETVLKSKKPGEGYFCWAKKGGCGAQIAINSPAFHAIEAQDTGKVENENPADFWNTARKMAFKRGFVHAIINATNTSELWSQDLEDLAANGVMGTTPEPEPMPKNRTEPDAGESFETASASRPSSKPPQTPKNAPTATQGAGKGKWQDVVVPKFIKKYAGQTLGEMADKDLLWWAENYQPKPYQGKITEADQDFRDALTAAAEDYRRISEDAPADSALSGDVPF